MEIFSLSHTHTVCPHFKPRLDDGHRQHEYSRHSSSPSPQQHRSCGSRLVVLEEVLLEGVVGAEVEPHAWDGPGERLEE